MSLSPRSLHRAASLQEQAYQSLKTAILSGELLPGQRLVESQLAETLQVSRTPVREALRQLQREHLVTPNPMGILHVTLISVADAADLYDCRIALEDLAIRGACQQITDAQLQELEQLLLQTEKLVDSPPTQLTRYRLLDLDYRFHRLLAQSSANPWLVELLDQVFDKMQLLRIQTIQRNPEVLEVRVEHRQIYEAVCDRNPHLAAQAIKTHLIASQQRVIQEIQQLQQQVEQEPG